MATADIRSLFNSVHRQLADEGCSLSWYAVLDAARDASIHARLLASGIGQTCLHESDCAPDIEEVGAHLVTLEPSREFTDWVLTEGWGNSWGIFVLAPADYRTLADHLRKFLKVRLPDGEIALFRFYDPRVLRVFLPTCAPDEVRPFFGPIRDIVLEDDEGRRLLRYRCSEQGLEAEVLDVIGPREKTAGHR